jgi:hypothetical protein
VVQQLARDQAMAQQLAFRQQPHSSYGPLR